MLSLVWLIPALPLLGFAILLCFGSRIGEPVSGWIATAMTTAAFVVSVIVFFGLHDRNPHNRTYVLNLFTWIPAGTFTVDIGFLVDPLSVTMILFITGVGALIHLYSIGYMHGDSRFPKFFVYLNLFVFSMLMLVLGNNLLLTFLGWEGVGVCSWLLISFWFEEPANGSAAKKAFIANRIGDWGFMVGIFLTWFTFGSITYTHFLPVSQSVATTTASAISLLFVLGAVGKSAQIPLYIWLPDAMAGPTPVSALIHAATMVTAGVYLLVRINPVLHAASPWVSTFIAWLGVLTALLAATIALAQSDIKKVLAYSTVSQLGYMFLAVGSGGYWAAIFHMITHAFFKALLFLGAGSVIHGMHDEQDMRRMGALRKLMPITAGCFIVGWLAIAGVPPLSGYWSKDEILAYALHKSIWLYLIGLFTVLLTVYYMSREVFLVFYGKARWQDSEAEVPVAVGAEGSDVVATAPADAAPAVGGDADADTPLVVHPHESPWTMTVPLVVLAILAATAGFINLPFTFDTHFLEDWLAPVTGRYGAVIDYSNLQILGLLVVSAIVGFTGIGIAYAIYIRHRVPEKTTEPDFLYNGWYIDRTVSNFMGGPGRVGYAAIAWFDRTIIDGAVNGIGHGARLSGNLFRRAQNGYVRSYALGVTVGALALAVYMLTRASFEMEPLLVAARAPVANGFPVLTAIILTPLIGALIIALIPNSRPDMHRLVAIVSAVLAGAFCIYVLCAFKLHDPGFQFVVRHTWVSSLDIKFYLGIDGISLFLLVLTGILFPIALFAARPDQDEKGYYFWITLLEAGCLGVFAALDLFLFFLLFELTIVPLYFLIGRWGHGRRVYAATKFFIFTMAGSALMLVSIIALGVLSHAGPGGGISFDLLKVTASHSVGTVAARWIFLGFVIAFAIKTPVVPFHTWLPDAHTEAPTAGSIDLAGVLLKLGTYGFLRYGLFLFPEASVWFAPVMLTLATVGIIYGAVVATMQRNLKRLVAYSSVAHMGFAVLGAFAINTQAIEGSVLVMVNHGIITGGLFILLGYIYTRRHTYEISSLQGLAKVAPWFAGAFTLVMLASIGVPGLSGFVGEFLVLLGTFVAHRWWAVIAATGVILAALYLLWAYQRVFQGEPTEENKTFPDLRLTERLVMLPLIGLIVFLGVYPKPVLDRIEPSVRALVAHVEESVPSFHAAHPQSGARAEGGNR